MTFVSDLAPQPLWGHFDTILTIPRGSKSEEGMRAHVIDVAERNGFRYQVDDAGNVIVNKPGTPGGTDAPATILQAHLDMVNEKNSGVDFDFESDAIRPILDGEYLRADGTTLGADNGIGVAAMLAVMDATDLVHGPLELLFTVDEETGLTGAKRLDASLLKGTRLINLDSEEEDVVTVGCAGGAGTDLTLGLERLPPAPGSEAYRVELSGLQGGHSGVDIHRQRGNAVQLLARLLQNSVFGLGVAELVGGDKHNAIPREARATVVIPADERVSFLAHIEELAAEIEAEFAVVEPDMTMRVEQVALPTDAASEDSSQAALRLLVALPHGVVAMSLAIPGLVETSTNVAAARLDDAGLRVSMSSRSSVPSGLEWIRQKIESVAELTDAWVRHHDGYPGWRPNLDSPLLATVRRVHAHTFGAEPRVEAIHAGLECGLIGRLIPGLDMVSIGPQIEFPHSPSERVRVASVGRFYTLLSGILRALAQPE